MTQCVVLIVDENEKNRRLARDVLEGPGVRTLEAAGGGEGVVTALARLPGVVLMDIRLPDMDGIEAARRIKADARTAGIPVVALTSLVMKGTATRCSARDSTAIRKIRSTFVTAPRSYSASPCLRSRSPSAAGARAT